jgi:type II secretory pathway pseudopilin PulG
MKVPFSSLRDRFLVASKEAVNDRLKALLQRGRQGFVMLEIVMALGLFALVAVGMTQALDQIAQTSKLARQEAQLLRALDSALAQVVHLPEFKKSSYAFPESDEGIVASAQIERVDLYTREKALLDKMYRIQVEAWIKNGSEVVLRRGIETYVYSPQSSL